MGQPESRSTRRASRRDGWTPERQLRFLAMLSHAKSVTKAAAAAGMSRESAYRLRARDPHGLFAAAWAGALKSEPTPVKVHKHPIAGISERRRRTILNRYFSREIRQRSRSE
jgi:hypothetical protein